MIRSGVKLSATATPSVDGTIRVAFLIDSLGRGGAEELLSSYVALMPDLGVEPSVVVIQDRDGNPLARPIAAAGVPVASLGINRLRERGAMRRVEEALRSTEPQLIHTQLEFANILGTLAARRLGVPAVSTLHTLDRPAPWTRDAARIRLMAWALKRHCDSVIAVSRSAADHFAGRSGAARGLVTTIHNGIDLQRFRRPPERDTVRRSLGIPEQAPLLTTVAVLREPKGIQDMIAAMPAVVAAVPEAHYLVVGDGEERDRLRRVAADSPAVNRIHLAGHRDDIPELLGACDLFVLPSHTEALPTVLIEAMASSLPLVATAVGGIPEMVEPGVSALLVPPRRPDLLGDAAARILASPLQAAAMGKAGRRIAVDRFEVRRQAGRVVAEYRRLLAGAAS